MYRKAMSSINVIMLLLVFHLTPFHGFLPYPTPSWVISVLCFKVRVLPLFITVFLYTTDKLNHLVFVFPLTYFAYHDILQFYHVGASCQEDFIFFFITAYFWCIYTTISISILLLLDIWVASYSGYCTKCCIVMNTV